MASLASNSDSLETYKIAQLHERLMQPQLQDGSDPPLPAKDFRSKDASTRASPNTKLPRSKTVEASSDMTAQSISKIESSSDMAVVQDSSSYPHMKSFAGLATTYDGDTQEMPSQVYRDYDKSILGSDAFLESRPDDTTDSLSAFLQSRPDDTIESQFTYSQYTTQHEASLAHGQSGHIDLMQHIQDSQGPTYHEISSDADSDGDGDDGDETQRLLSSVNRPAFPKTPATAPRKRNHLGEPVSIASSKTPGSGMSMSAFGPAGVFGPPPDMTATQMFQATQAPSSPTQDAPRSDPVFTRPSPNLLQDLDTQINSPRLLQQVSPIMHNRTPHTRATTEPRDTYKPMKESQDRRKRRSVLPRDASNALGPHHQSRQPDDAADLQSDTDGEEDQDSAQLRQARRRRHAIITKQAMRSWDGVKAPERKPSRPLAVSPAYGKHIPRVTFRRSTSRDRQLIDLPDAASPDVDPMDEYDEFAQDVRPSQQNLEHDDQHDDQHDDKLDDQHDDQLDDQHDDQLDDQLDDQHDDRLDDQIDYPDYPSAFTVADSQPAGEETKQLPSAPVPSSLTSIVPGSQYPRASALEEKDEQGDSSSIPRPPPPTSPAPAPYTAQTLDSSPPKRPVNHSASMTSGNQPKLSTAVSSAANGGDKPVPVQNNINGGRSYHSPVAAALPDKVVEKVALESGQMQSSAIPETDPIDAEDGEPHEHLKLVPNDVGCSASNLSNDADHRDTSSAAFETAPTHQKALSLSQKQLSSQRSHSHRSTQSPRKQAGIPRFAEIASEKTPPDSLEDLEIDVDVLAADREYADAMNSSASEPVNRRIRVYGKKAKRTNSQMVHALGQRMGVPTTQAQRNPSDHAALPEGSGEHQSSSNHEDPATSITGQQMPESLKDIKGKSANAMLSARVVEQHVSEAQPSPRVEEVAAPRTSSQRASQPISDNVAASKKPRGKLTRPKNKMQAKGAHKKTPRADHRHAAPEIAETPHAIPVASVIYDRDVDMDDAPETGLSPSSSESLPPPDNIAEPDSTHIAGASVKDFPFPDRVFALFSGSVHGYFPATCLGPASPDGQKVHVRFDDGTITQLEIRAVRRLQLRPGDQVKVNLDGLRNKVHFVIGLKNPIGTTSEGQYPRTDVEGHTELQVMPKEGRDSTSTSLVSAAVTLTVSIADLYLPHTMFVKFKGRDYEVASTSKHASRMQTPVTDPTAPATPGSRVRRSLITPAIPSGHIDVASPLPSRGIFAGMAFATSYSEMNGTKYGPGRDHIIKLIQRNGGFVVEKGFDELFEPVDLFETVETNPADGASPRALEVLTLSGPARNLGFVALIANEHSRRAKYMQALALSLPCLSDRWIIDCMAAGAPVPWPKYLLPAGESAHLYNAVRSRTLASYDVGQAKLAETIANRDRLLHGGRVLLVGPGGKAKWEARKAYAFLTIALGAANVRRVVGLEAAKQILVEEDGAWDWVYVEGKIEDAEILMFGRSRNEVDGVKSASTLKRKRGSAASFQGVEKMIASDGKVKIVGDEFVVQSLILGSLLDG